MEGKRVNLNPYLDNCMPFFFILILLLLFGWYLSIANRENILLLVANQETQLSVLGVSSLPDNIALRREVREINIHFFKTLSVSLWHLLQPLMKLTNCKRNLTYWWFSAICTWGCWWWGERRRWWSLGRWIDRSQWATQDELCKT